MTATNEEILNKYIELRDRKAVVSKRQAEENKKEMEPIEEAMGNIENYFMHLMNETGIDSIKINGVGTVFKGSLNSCQINDGLEFKKFVFAPVIQHIINYFRSSGYDVRDIDHECIERIVHDLPRWDMVDFRAGKKGIQEFIANENAPVPGVAINTIATVNVRRA